MWFLNVWFKTVSVHPDVTPCCWRDLGIQKLISSTCFSPLKASVWSKQLQKPRPPPHQLLWRGSVWDPLGGSSVSRGTRWPSWRPEMSAVLSPGRSDWLSSTRSSRRWRVGWRTTTLKESIGWTLPDPNIQVKFLVITAFCICVYYYSGSDFLLRRNTVVSVRKPDFRIIALCSVHSRL